jgi:hypothetical protein
MGVECLEYCKLAIKPLAFVLVEHTFLIYLKNPPPLAVVMYLGLCRMINFDG